MGPTVSTLGYIGGMLSFPRAVARIRFVVSCCGARPSLHSLALEAPGTRQMWWQSQSCFLLFFSARGMGAWSGKQKTSSGHADNTRAPDP